MITKELVKAEVEKVNDDYLEVLYKIIKVFEAPRDLELTTSIAKRDGELEWHAFIAQTYGSLANDPIERGDQGRYEIREAMQ